MELPASSGQRQPLVLCFIQAAKLATDGQPVCLRDSLVWCVQSNCLPYSQACSPE